MLLIYIYIAIPNCDNVTTYCHMYFTILLHCTTYFIACILKCNVTQPDRCPTETVAPVACVERCAVNVSDHTLDRACTCLLDQVTLAFPTHWRPKLTKSTLYSL